MSYKVWKTLWKLDKDVSAVYLDNIRISSCGVRARIIYLSQFL